MSLTRISPAKINLTLRVGHARPDGFHELESLVALLDLGDTITVSPRGDEAISLKCSDPTIPQDERNLAWRATAALREATTTAHGVDIVIDKRIPAGGGLGGGSSNAATTLELLNELWQLELPAARLATIGATIGSDIPLFFHGPLCVMRGRGEIVEPLDRKLDGWVVLVMPDVHCDTAAVYRAFDELSAPTPGRAVEDVLAADTPAAMMPLLFNDLERAALDISPDLASHRLCLEDTLGAAVRMTGSGAVFYHLYDTQSAAESAAQATRETFAVRVEVTRLASS